MRFTSLLRLCLVALLHPSVAVAQQQVRYFSLDWCPSKTERGQIEAVMRTTYVGCCLYKAEPREGVDADAVLRAYADRMIDKGDLFGRCTGQDPEQLERLKQERHEQAAARAARARAEAADAPNREAADRASLPKRLAALSQPAFCVAYGRAFRGDRSRAPSLAGGEVRMIFADEARRRGLVIDDFMTKRRAMRLQATVCEVYASMGLPEAVNRTVTSAGEAVQHVYGVGVYVYTVGGVVTAWQD